MSDDVLSYLQGDSQGARRDMIARCYYEVAQGDPKSGPVAFAILLNACAEQFARTPDKLLKLTSDFIAAVNTARQLERGVIERVEKSNASVIATFKDETARATLTFREASVEAKATMVQTQRIQVEIKSTLARTEEIGNNLILLRNDLQRFDTSVQRVEKLAGDVRDTHLVTLDLVRHLTKEIRANWAIIGLGFGMALEYALMATEAPPWVTFIFFLVLAGLAQGLLRWDWKLVRKLIKKIPVPAKTKPAEK